MKGHPMVTTETQNRLSRRIGRRISTMMSLEMQSSGIGVARYGSSECCSNPDFEIIAVRRLGCHFYEVIKDHQLVLTILV